jgi:hypothetical protein
MLELMSEQGKGNRIAEKPPQHRPSVTHFHGSNAYHLFAIAKTRQVSLK